MCEESKLNTFVTLFDSEGFESIIDITEMEEEHVLQKLTKEDYDENSKAGKLVGQMTMRARFNGHRKSQVWVFTAAAVGADTLMDIATSNPQGMADLIRKNGVEVFSQYSIKEANKVLLRENL